MATRELTPAERALLALETALVLELMRRRDLLPAAPLPERPTRSNGATR